MAYLALGESVPKKLWLTYFVAQGDGKFDIKGKAANVQDVYSFYSNMRESLINTPLRLQELEMESQSIDDAVSGAPGNLSNYRFEITNMSSADMAPPSQNQTNEQQPGGNNNNNQASNGNNDSMLNKPLLNFGKSEEN